MLFRWECILLCEYLVGDDRVLELQFAEANSKSRSLYSILRRYRLPPLQTRELTDRLVNIHISFLRDSQELDYKIPAIEGTNNIWLMILDWFFSIIRDEKTVLFSVRYAFFTHWEGWIRRKEPGISICIEVKQHCLSLAYKGARLVHQSMLRRGTKRCVWTRTLERVWLENLYLMQGNNICSQPKELSVWFYSIFSWAWMDVCMHTRFSNIEPSHMTLRLAELPVYNNDKQPYSQCTEYVQPEQL